MREYITKMAKAKEVAGRILTCEKSPLYCFDFKAFTK